MLCRVVRFCLFVYVSVFGMLLFVFDCLFCSVVLRCVFINCSFGQLCLVLHSVSVLFVSCVDVVWHCVFVLVVFSSLCCIVIFCCFSCRWCIVVVR